MAQRWKSAIATGLLVLVTLVGACAPQSTMSQTSGGAVVPPDAQAVAPPPRGPKILTLAIQNEPKGLINELALENSRVGGVGQPRAIVHNQLARENDKGQFIPELAPELPSLERGTWRVNADGSMDVTWKLRPNLKWHDGTPFTADDLAFTYMVFKTPEIPNTVGRPIQLMTSVTAPDPLTLVVHWSAIFVDADRAPGLTPMPRHLLEETYRTDTASFANSPLLRSEFVGLGPYQLERWVPGSQLELVPFDQFWRGRPPLDRVVVKFLGDPNTMVANVLSEAVDAVLAPAVDLEAALEVRKRWEGTGNQVLVGPSGNFRYFFPQQRAELARPRNGFTDPVVRQAFYSAMDRQTMADVLTQGLAPVADSWYEPSSPLRGPIESAIPQYPYDLGRAQQLLSRAGWMKGADGVLVHQQSGERFEVRLSGTQQKRVEQEEAAAAVGFKAIGAQVEPYQLPAALSGNNEVLHTQPGATIWSVSDPQRGTTLHSRFIPSAENRWTGSNSGGYGNLEVDAQLDRLAVTIAPAERIAIERDLVREVMGDAGIWPMYWDLTHVIALKHVKGIPGGAGAYHTWNFVEWDRD